MELHCKAELDTKAELDVKWLREFKEQEKDYNMFYKDKPTSVKLYFLYVNHYNVVEFFKNDTYLLNQEKSYDDASAEEAMLRKDVLLSIIKNNTELNGRKYKLVSLLKFNLDIEPEDIISMTLDKQDGTEYLSSEKEIKDIIFHDTICIFQDINSLFFVYQERLKIAQAQTVSGAEGIPRVSGVTGAIAPRTKKIYLPSSQHHHNSKKKYTLKRCVNPILKKV